MKKISNHQLWRLALGVSSLALCLSGCGGGGKGASLTMTSTPNLPVTNLQGIWGPGTLGLDVASAVAFSDGTLWLVSSSGASLQLYTATFQGDASNYTATGKKYTSGAIVAPVSVVFTALATSKTSFTGTVTPTGGSSSAFNLGSYSASRYETPASLAELAGSWTGTRGGGTQGVTWTLSATGGLTGSSTNGCTYTGSAVVHTVPVPVGVFDLTLHESCNVLAVTTLKDFSGIVTLSADKLAANFAFTTSSGLEGDIQPTTKL
jgi:hypothetical protein